MKVGILTFHRTANDGSVLQNWCLQRLIGSMLPDARVETIDLRDTRRERQELRRMLSREPPFFQIEALRKMIGLRGFLRHNIEMSPVLRTASLNRARRLIEAQRYGAVVSGSDTVWQVARIGDTEPPHIYFQPGSGYGRKIAFAVSADPLSDTSILQDRDKRAALAQAVDAFDFIGVRDEPTRALIASLGIPEKRIHFTPDPTVLVDFSSLVESPPRRVNGPPLAGIALNSRALARTLAALLQARGWQVMNHLGRAPAGARSIPGSESLGQRLGRFASQDLLITDRFHSSIFTLKLGHAPVIFVESTKKWPEPTSKGRDLFKRLDLESFVWRAGPDPASEIEPLLGAAGEWLQAPPDMNARFTALRDSGRPALAELDALLART